MEDNVGQEVGGASEVLLQHRRTVNRLLLIGKSIEVAAHAFKPIGDVVGASALSSLEAQMFDEMGHS